MLHRSGEKFMDHGSGFENPIRCRKLTINNNLSLNCYEMAILIAIDIIL